MLDRLLAGVRGFLGGLDPARGPRLPAERSVADVYRFGREAELAGRPASAIEAYEEVVKREPGHAEAHGRLAELVGRRGDRQDALVHALTALRAEETPQAMLDAAEAYAAAGRDDDALALYRDLLARDAGHVTALRRMRDLAALRARWSDAMGAQERLVRLSPAAERTAERGRLAGLHCEVGHARLDQGDTAGAIAAFRDALRVQADFLPAAVALGDAYLRAGDPSQALRVWERAVEVVPALPLLTRIEQRYRAEDRPRRMIALYERALERTPDSLALGVALGRVYFELSMLDQAAEQFEKLEVRAPDLPAVHVYLGAIFEQRGQTREASEEYRRALQSTGQFEWPHRCVGCGTTRTGWVERCPSCRQWNTLQP
jgi:lipopolysaccharide biosynthesis regulator YciM